MESDKMLSRVSAYWAEENEGRIGISLCQNFDSRAAPPPVFVMFNTANACSSCSVHAAFACVGWGAIAVFDWRGAMNGWMKDEWRMNDDDLFPPPPFYFRLPQIRPICSSVSVRNSFSRPAATAQHNTTRPAGCALLLHILNHKLKPSGAAAHSLPIEGLLLLQFAASPPPLCCCSPLSLIHPWKILLEVVVCQLKLAPSA